VQRLLDQLLDRFIGQTPKRESTSRRRREAAGVQKR